MRITGKAKVETRARILEAAANLFKTNGFSQTTTPDIARVTGIAAGTLFNCFVIRAAHRGVVTQLIEASDGAPFGLYPHLYWTLFLGVLNFWAGDEPRHQEETLALLDQSMEFFAESLAGRQGRTSEADDGPILQAQVRRPQRNDAHETHT